MPDLKLSLLGSPQIERQGEVVQPDTRKAVALLAYLAVSEQFHRRDALATLLWPEYKRERAFANLRRTLWSLNQSIGKEWLDLDSDVVGLKPSSDFFLDVAAFRHQLASAEPIASLEPAECATRIEPLEAAVTLYRGDFMAGFSLRDSPPFDDWQLLQAESLRQDFLQTLGDLSECHRICGQLREGIRCASRAVAVDPLRESAHRDLMRLYQQVGQRISALQQYQTCAAALEKELGVPPEAETRALRDSIRSQVEDEDKVQTAAPLMTEGRQQSAAQIARQSMISSVRAFWIQGVLENSLHDVALLEMGLKQEMGVVDHPWDMLLRIADLSGETLSHSIQISDLFDRLNGKLLILGNPGGGKTTMLLELARDLLDRADTDELRPIPVVFSLSTWARERPALSEWLCNELRDKYQVPEAVARHWVDEDRLTLLLDGLDEVLVDRREACVQAINTYRQEHGFVDVVICSRSAEYETLVNKLMLNGALVLQPLTDAQIDACLDRMERGSATLNTLLKSDHGLRAMCQSPLFLSVLVLTYQHLSSDDLPGLGEIGRRQLFDAYVERMLQQQPEDPPYSKTDTTRFLAWLARCMKASGLTLFQVEDIRPEWLQSARQQRQYRHLVSLMAAVLDGLIVATAIGFPLALYQGIGPGLSIGVLSWAIWVAASGAATQLGVGLSARAWTSVLAVWASSFLACAMSFGPLAVLAMSMVVAFIGGFIPGDEEKEEAMHTRTRQEAPVALRRALRKGLMGGLAAGLVGGTVVGLVHGLVAGLASGLVLGLLVCVMRVTASSELRAGWRRHILQRILCRSGCVPRHLNPMLEYGVRLVLLRQVGQGYIFVHRYLLEYFARSAGGCGD